MFIVLWALFSLTNETVGLVFLFAHATFILKEKQIHNLYLHHGVWRLKFYNTAYMKKHLTERQVQNQHIKMEKNTTMAD